ncbi:MAG: hypothetical protein ACM31C_04120 [Acidobacteriota bacterium]
MKLVILASLVLAGSADLASASGLPEGWVSPARPDQLNSKHHLLRVQPEQPGQIPETADDSVSRLAVGATVTLAVPSQLGLGHGPFFTIYDEPATLAVTAGDAVEVSAPRGDHVDVRCKRAGVFELSIDVASKGKHVADTVELGCIEPTRLAASNLHAAADPYLAGASEVTVAFVWFGKLADGHEAPLVGTLPVVLAPGETALAPRTATGGAGAFVALHAAKQVRFASYALRAALPIEIVDARAWKLDIELEDTREIWHDAHVSLARARAVDARGRALAGLHECALTTYRDGAASDPETSCMARVVRGEATRRRLPRSTWSAERVCFEVLGERACKQVP